MKTIKYLTLRLMAVAAIAIAFALPAKAQVTPFTYFNVDWQFNALLSAITLQTKQAVGV